MSAAAGSRPIRVLHVVSAGELGGAERMLLDLVTDDPGTSHTIALFSPSDRVLGAFRDAGVAVHEHKVRSEGPFAMVARAMLPGDVAWLTSLLEATRAEVVHLHTFGSQVVGTRAALARKLPIVRTEHSTRVFDDPSCWVFVRFVIGDAAISCSVSDDVRQVAKKKLPALAPRLRVIPNGVRLEAFPPLPTRAAGAHPRAAVVSRLEPRKGVDVVLRALVGCPELELDVCGDGPDAPKLRELARTLGIAHRTRFLGHVSDVSAALRDVDMVISGARKEGLGLTLLEAMASRRVVVATPVGGVPEFVRDGDTGLLSRDGSPEALARAIARARALAQADREALVERARAVVERTYSLAAMRAAYAAIYRELTSR